MFTAHPTFALPPEVAQALAAAACGRPAPGFASHRPAKVTLEDEFAQATAAIVNGRDALDRLNAALLSVARDAWPDRWTELMPRPVILSSWVGYDTDGRTDIGWWDTLRLRLRMKRLQLLRLDAQFAALPGTEALVARTDRALDAVQGADRRLPGSAPTRLASRRSRTRSSDRREDALVSPEPLLAPARARRSVRPTTRPSSRSASRAPAWCRTACRSPTRMFG